MTWMLDTDVCIQLINQNTGYESIIERMDGLVYGDILISAISRAELSYGEARSGKRASNLAILELFLHRFEIAPFDDQAAQIYGPTRQRLQSKGKPIDLLDMLIASHALSRQSILVTHNVREFLRVDNLQVEDWLSD